ncbi:MAG: hypothetical protein H6506_03940 [Calditrichaeota bacterium]|nr:hypothetical protein [Calditrichota bacterium]MCB9367226.1 hypothetical protein [Calditrichota bacterium]MCB9391785.1 hypothetical protein [Calditrichota bacterium]
MRLVTILFALLLACTTAWAVGPTTMTYQAIFTTPEGELMPDGVYEIGFHVYTAAFGGPPVWSEWQDVTVVDGIFDVVLGAFNPLTPAVFPQAGAWLSLTYEQQAFGPRQFIHAVPYAFISCWADSARIADTTRVADSARVAGSIPAGGYSQLQLPDDEISNTQTQFHSGFFSFGVPSTLTFFATAIVEDDDESEGVLWRGRLEVLNSVGTVVATSREVKQVAPGDLVFQSLDLLPAGSYRLRLTLWTSGEADVVYVEDIDFGATWIGGNTISR